MGRTRDYVSEVPRAVFLPAFFSTMDIERKGTVDVCAAGVPETAVGRLRIGLPAHLIL